MLRYHNITKDDMLNGEGLRVVLWLAGCTHQCYKCQNPQTWDINGGLEFDQAAKDELFEDLSKPYISGITFSGGDPMHPHNREEVFELAKEIKEKFPNKNIWLYTGFLWEDFKDNPMIKYIDVFVDGEYHDELNDNTLHWVGSSNQKIVKVHETLETGELCTIPLR